MSQTLSNLWFLFLSFDNNYHTSIIEVYCLKISLPSKLRALGKASEIPLKRYLTESGNCGPWVSATVSELVQQMALQLVSSQFSFAVWDPCTFLKVTRCPQKLF